MQQDRRKKLRLDNFDYSSNGAYFVTVCTHQKAEYFGKVGKASEIADVIGAVFEETLHQYPCISCPRYVVMPNHFHALIVIERMDSMPAETISDFIRSFKSKSTVSYIRMVKDGKAMPFEGRLWQRSYYDHIIRNEQDFLEVWKYIEENPLRWQMEKQKNL